jgi:1,4-dihydroxy-6-naphthoate synthase
MGDRYGPMVVAPRPMDIEDLRGRTIAIPGEMTTAFLALNLLLGPGSFKHEVVMFDRIFEVIHEGRADAGLIIHEGQLTYQKEKLHEVADLGQWWFGMTRLPLPLGGNVIRRDLGDANMRQIAAILKRSIEYGLAHRQDALDYALQYARDMEIDLADRFVGMYVNEWTLDFGPEGRKAARELLRRGFEAGLVPDAGEIDFI